MAEEKCATHNLRNFPQFSALFVSKLNSTNIVKLMILINIALFSALRLVCVSNSIWIFIRNNISYAWRIDFNV